MESCKSLKNFLVLRWNEDDQSIEILESQANDSYPDAFYKYFSNIYRVRAFIRIYHSLLLPPSIRKKVSREG
jgi:hypothetical protein